MLPFGFDHLWREIFRSPAKLLVLWAVVIVAGKAKVCKFSLSLGIEEDVLWLDILVDDVLCMETLHCLDHFA